MTPRDIERREESLLGQLNGQYEQRFRSLLSERICEGPSGAVISSRAFLCLEKHRRERLAYQGERLRGPRIRGVL
jgi:hypothetical protein